MVRQCLFNMDTGGMKWEYKGEGGGETSTSPLGIRLCWEERMSEPTKERVAGRVIDV